ncbi:MAG: uncharacterized protein JWP97_1041 [Labilithrix sp.]|nr:uncharacterized protein [Labilithrix sp.]
MSVRRAGVAGLCALSAAALACACSFALDGYAGPPLVPEAESGAPDGAVVVDAAVLDSGSDAPDAAPSCPAGRGPSMVRISAPGAAFCIDSTEVSNAQYAKFLLSDPQPADQPGYCKDWNTTFRPTDQASFEDPAHASYPVVNVDWCDAHTFCAWAGKRLCGKVGGGGSSPALFGTTSNETFVACSKAGERAYPYANTWNNDACNAKGTGAIEPVGSRPSCQGGYEGVFDLIGNVSEWQDDCDGHKGATDSCPDNSSTFAFPMMSNGSNQRCDHFDPQFRADAYFDLGFRCCAD